MGRLATKVTRARPPSVAVCALALVSFLSALADGARANKPQDAVLLSNVETLTLRGHGAKTTHRRVSAIPQLRCISSPDICSLYHVDVMRCTNAGSSYGDLDVEWTCTASVPETLKLGSTDVICEGYSSPDDPYVLKGSCAVEYRMILTDKGEQMYPDLGHRWGGEWLPRLESGNVNWAAVVFLSLVASIFLWVIYQKLFANRPRRRPSRATGGLGRRGGGGGGGGGGGWNPSPFDDDPPPPYPGSKSRPSTRQGPEQGWRPGFWTGLGSGAAAAYMAGNRGQSSRSRGSGGSSGPSSSGSASQARHESTGFGSTSRR